MKLTSYIDSNGNTVEIGDFIFISFNYIPTADKYDYIGIVMHIGRGVIRAEIEGVNDYESVFQYETLKMNLEDPIIFKEFIPL